MGSGVCFINSRWDSVLCLFEKCLAMQAQCTPPLASPRPRHFQRRDFFMLKPSTIITPDIPCWFLHQVSCTPPTRHGASFRVKSPPFLHPIHSSSNYTQHSSSHSQVQTPRRSPRGQLCLQPSTVWEGVTSMTNAQAHLPLSNDYLTSSKPPIILLSRFLTPQ